MGYGSNVYFYLGFGEMCWVYGNLVDGLGLEFYGDVQASKGFRGLGLRFLGFWTGLGSAPRSRKSLNSTKGRQP